MATSSSAQTATPEQEGPFDIAARGARREDGRGAGGARGAQHAAQRHRQARLEACRPRTGKLADANGERDVLVRRLRRGRRQDAARGGGQPVPGRRADAAARASGRLRRARSRSTRAWPSCRRSAADRPTARSRWRGRSRLRDPVRPSTVNAYLRFKLSDAFLKQAGAAADDPSDGRRAPGKRPDGFYGMRLSGRARPDEPAGAVAGVSVSRHRRGRGRMRPSRRGHRPRRSAAQFHLRRRPRRWRRQLRPPSRNRRPRRRRPSGTRTSRAAAATAAATSRPPLRRRDRLATGDRRAPPGGLRRAPTAAPAQPRRRRPPRARRLRPRRPEARLRRCRRSTTSRRSDRSAQPKGCSGGPCRRRSTARRPARGPLAGGCPRSAAAPTRRPPARSRRTCARPAEWRRPGWPPAPAGWCPAPPGAVRLRQPERSRGGSSSASAVIRPVVAAAGQDGGPADHVPQLADVAGPVGARPSAASAAGSSSRGPTSGAISSRKCSASRGMSPRRSRKGGSAQAQPGQAVVEVRPERPSLHLALQVAQRHGDDPRAHRDLARAADAPQSPRLQHAQQLGLQVQRQLADLVQDQRPAGRLLEPAGPSRARAGEGPPLVPEQLALGQLARQRAAVDRHERPVPGAGPARAAPAPAALCRSRSRRSPAPGCWSAPPAPRAPASARNAGSSPTIAAERWVGVG